MTENNIDSTVYYTAKKVISNSIWDAITIDAPTYALTYGVSALFATNPVGWSALGVMVATNTAFGVGGAILGYGVRKAANEYFGENTTGSYVFGFIGGALKYGIKDGREIGKIIIGGINGFSYEYFTEKINKDIDESKYLKLFGKILYIEGIQEEIVLNGALNFIQPPVPGEILNLAQKITAFLPPSLLITTSINIQQKGYKSYPVEIINGAYELIHTQKPCVYKELKQEGGCAEFQLGICFESEDGACNYHNDQASKSINHVKNVDFDYFEVCINL